MQSCCFLRCSAPLLQVGPCMPTALSSLDVPRKCDVFDLTAFEFQVWWHYRILAACPKQTRHCPPPPLEPLRQWRARHLARCLSASPMKTATQIRWQSGRKQSLTWMKVITEFGVECNVWLSNSCDFEMYSKFSLCRVEKALLVWRMPQ